MKRVTSIEIQNFRAYFGNYDPISLPNGQNLLIYGENGSGKSSFFKAISNFLSSSRTPNFFFTRNAHQPTTPGQILLTFSDYDNTNLQVVPQTNETATFGDTITDTDTRNYIRDAELNKGFLDYRSLLKVYNHTEANPNLFDLIIKELLFHFIPVAGTYALGTKWVQLTEDMKNVYNRNELKHRNAYDQLPAYEHVVRENLNLIFVRLNIFLATYFEMGLEIQYSLLPFLPYDYFKWYPVADLRLTITLNGTLITDPGEFLNEARLAALSICLYLAALKENPQALDYKILFLDDIFIGLDTGNRIPILKILKGEFSDYQIFITTYDRQWFELAQKHFQVHAPELWIYYEFYAQSMAFNNSNFEKPLMVSHETNYEKAVKFLHHRSAPDYPAAANYFRKATEEIISELVPAYELTDSELVQIPGYKLNIYIDRTFRFLQKTNNSIATIGEISALIPALLHPLSHHNISSPVYRSELKIIEENLPNLKSELQQLNIATNFKCSILQRESKVLLTYTINAVTGHFSFNELRMKENVLLINSSTGIPRISRAHCVLEKCWGMNNGVPVPHSRITFPPERRNQPDLNFDSLEEAFQRIHARMIVRAEIGQFPIPTDFFSVMQYMDSAGIYHPLIDIRVW